MVYLMSSDEAQPDRVGVLKRMGAEGTLSEEGYREWERIQTDEGRKAFTAFLAHKKAAHNV